MMGERMTETCSSCGMPAYANGEGTWFGPDGKLMCPSCAEGKITPGYKLRWDSDKGTWVKDAP